MIPSGQFDMDGPGDVARTVARPLAEELWLLCAIDDEGRHPDRRQHVANVDLGVHSHERTPGAGAHTESEDRGEGAKVLFVQARGEPTEHLLREGLFSPTPFFLSRLAQPILLAISPREVRGPQRSDHGAAEHERPGALRVRGREEDAHRASFRQAEESSLLGADGIHHGPDVVHALLERWSAGHSIRHAGSALVEDDQPGKRSQPPVERGPSGNLPRQFDV
jgi:hypothetical protein